MVCKRVTRLQSQSNKKKYIYIYIKSEEILAVNQLQILALSSVQSDCYYIKCEPYPGFINVFLFLRCAYVILKHFDDQLLQLRSFLLCVNPNKWIV